MPLKALKKLWKNKYFHAIMSVVLAFLVAFGLLLGLRLALGVECPLLVVSSGSMMPTLNIGDLIVVQRVDPSQINADKLTGDIVVFRDPRSPSDLIVHRAIKIYKGEGGRYLIVTLGDAMIWGEKDQFSPWDSSLLVGKVVMRIPYIGNLTLFFYSEKNLTAILLLMILILAIFLVFIELNWKEASAREKAEKPQKFNMRIAYVIAVNILMVFLIIFSLWGYLTFWQPGATPPREVAILGMYRDLQLHAKRFGKAILSLSFMTYRIDSQLDGGMRLGVPTFSWFQFLLLILALFDGWEIFDLIYPRKAAAPSKTDGSDLRFQSASIK